MCVACVDMCVARVQGDSCCWVCTWCEAWQRVLDATHCVDCPEGWWPSTDRSECFRLTQQYVRWWSVYALAPATLALIGILLTLLVLVVFLRNVHTPVVKASGRELSFLLLSGFLVCFAMTFVLLTKPSVWSCAAARVGIGLGFAITYGALLTKTNRIARIFESATRSARAPAFVSPKSQLVITALLVGVQLASTCVWLVLEPPGVRLYYPTHVRSEIVLKCRADDMSLLYSLTYNMLLVAVCTLYAVKTRTIPENFNESKFIGFAMYTTCIIWLAFVPIYFSTLNSFQVNRVPDRHSF